MSVVTSILIAIVLGGLSWFATIFVLSITDARSKTIDIAAPAIAIIVAALVICIACPIHQEVLSQTGTITKMEETASSYNIVHRHAYIVTEKGEGICINLNESDFAILSVNDNVKLTVTITDHIIGGHMTEYKLND